MSRSPHSSKSMLFTRMFFLPTLYWYTQCMYLFKGVYSQVMINRGGGDISNEMLFVQTTGAAEFIVTFLRKRVQRGDPRAVPSRLAFIAGSCPRTSGC